MTTSAPSLTGRALGSLSLLLATTGPASLAMAANSHSHDGDSHEYETIVVTARHAEHDRPELPQSIQVIEAEELQMARLNSVEAMLEQLPGVEVSSQGSSSNTNVRIRGVGSLSKIGRNDDSVIVYVDNVPQSAGVSTLDIEHVEVFKGPQGTLFGRNSQAGAVNVITRQAAFHDERSLRAEVGQDNQRLIEGVYNTPLSDAVAVRIAGRFEGRDNPTLNENDGKPLTEPEQLSLRGKLRWELADEWTLALTAEHQRVRNYAFAYAMRPFGKQAVMDVPPGALDDDKDSDLWTLLLQGNLPMASLTATSAYYRADDKAWGAQYEGRIYNKILGFVPANGGIRSTENDEKFFNQELLLRSLPGSELNWSAGLHYYDQQQSSYQTGLMDDFFPLSPLNSDSRRRFDTTSVALFGELVYPLAEDWRVTLGGRQTRDKKRYRAEWHANAINPSPLRHNEERQSLTDSFFTGRVALQFDLDEDTLLYGSYSRGHKSGSYTETGTNIAMGLPEVPFKASDIDAIELGLKGVYREGDLRVNAALFFNDVADDHIFALSTTTFTLQGENLDTRTRGAELELDWHPMERLSLHGGLIYNDARMTAVPTSVGSQAEADNRVPDTARWQGSLALTHIQPLEWRLLGPVNLRTYLHYGYTGVRTVDPANSYELDAYHKVDMRLGLLRDELELYLWADNLLDQEIHLYGLYFAPFVPGGRGIKSGALARGRTFGLGVSYSF